MAKPDLSLKFKAIMKDLDQRSYQPVYTLCGDEPYFNDKICDRLESEILNESEKSFNQAIYYGKDIDTLSIVTAAKRYPMMADRQVIIIKEAQYLKDLDVLNPYLENPSPQTVLVFLFRSNGQLKKTNTFKLMSKYVVFESEKVPEYKLRDWVQNYMHEKGYKTDNAGLELIVESCGNELTTIENELSKIFLNLGERKVVAIKDIEKYIGISKEYSIFELQNAISLYDLNRMASILDYYASDTKTHSIIMTVSTLNGFFTKACIAATAGNKSDADLAGLIGVSPFFIKDYRNVLKHYGAAKIEHVLRALNTIDLKSKGIETNTGDENLYKELFIALQK